MTETTTYRMWLPTPAPYTGPHGTCVGCSGVGVTETVYEMKVYGTDRVMMVNAICDLCTGCGRNVHTDCPPDRHADWDGPDDGESDGEYDDIDLDFGGQLCMSCRGRQWNAVQAFGDDEDGTMIILKYPCGCAEPLMVLLDDEGNPAGPIPDEWKVWTR